MQRTKIKDLHDFIGEEVTIKGWVDSRRDHGKLAFFDIRDGFGVVQTVVKGDLYEAHDDLRAEWVVAVTGEVKERPENMISSDEANGDLEMLVTEIEVLNKAETPPFDIYGDGYEIDEDTRMKYRYLDLRRPRLQKNIRLRNQIIRFFRDYMHEADFIEIETPMLMKDTPEGSREYVVPSRLHQGNFYALPQSPQQFKQLTMVAGFERYFQVARCMRDEDLRGDRQPEFTQLDYEMSFVDQEDVLEFTEAMFIQLVKELFPEKKIKEKPFPRLTYEQSMEKHGSDKPDLRGDKEDDDELAFAWVVDFPMFEEKEDGTIGAMHHPFCSVKEEDKEKFLQDDLSPEELLSIRANAYDLVLNGYELSSGSIRIHEPTIQKRVFELLGVSQEEQAERFGHMLEAFSYGTPPHGGFAPGIDRIAMLLAGEPNIREVIAFPKNGEGKDPMMQAPSALSPQQLSELGLELNLEEDEE
jgi:aspartyl-tRNA synthetase